MVVSAKSKTHSVRIIGGAWRGRRLPVADFETLRPSKDFVRETLFNWLQPVIEGSRCLDVFAGSGALGFEAASRGAIQVTMLEYAPALCRVLEAQAAKLNASQVRIINTAAEKYLDTPGQACDIVFLDPPFGSALLPVVCRQLHKNGWLKAGSKVYLEASRASGLPELPESWVLTKQKTSGDVVYGLAEVGG